MWYDQHTIEKKDRRMVILLDLDTILLIDIVQNFICNFFNCLKFLPHIQLVSHRDTQILFTRVAQYDSYSFLSFIFPTQMQNFALVLIEIHLEGFYLLFQYANVLLKLQAVLHGVFVITHLCIICKCQNHILQLIIQTFISKLNNIGSRMEHCSTPFDVSFQLDISV